MPSPRGGEAVVGLASRKRKVTCSSTGRCPGRPARLTERVRDPSSPPTRSPSWSGRGEASEVAIEVPQEASAPCHRWRRSCAKRAGHRLEVSPRPVTSSFASERRDLASDSRAPAGLGADGTDRRRRWAEQRGRARRPIGEPALELVIYSIDMERADRDCPAAHFHHQRREDLPDGILHVGRPVEALRGPPRPARATRSSGSGSCCSCSVSSSNGSPSG